MAGIERRVTMASMAMEDSILKFPEQFDYEPAVQNAERLAGPFRHFVLDGMGGSHLAADLLKDHNPSLDLYVHRSYGLPNEAHHPPADELEKDRTLFIASSHSGNTEEVLDFAEEAFEKGYPLACIATGGKLIKFAEENDLPYIQLPDTGIQPRTALGFALLALVQLIDPDQLLELRAPKNAIDPSSLRPRGEEIAELLRDSVPIIYCSAGNTSIAYNWKIKFNETGKIPAFYNVFPELNHNEMTGFDVAESNKHLSEQFTFIFLRDQNDHEQIRRRIDVCKKLYEDRGFTVLDEHLAGESYFERAFNSLLTADWAALAIATMYGTEPEEVPMVEEFKKKIA
ncbi:MAG: SIS domain-containing protein [Candidatus Paceibacterota bacterium]